MSRVAVIGAGRIGSALGRHLLDAGNAVDVVDVSPTATAELVRHGATAAGSPAAAARPADVVLICVGFDSEVRQAALGPDGALAAMRPGSCLVVVSTVTPATMHVLAELASTGVDIVDAPVVGGEALAAKGELLVLAGGSAERIRALEPLFAAFASQVLRLGDVGAGQVGKSLNNYLLWVSTCANDDAARLTAAAGLDWEIVRAALVHGSGGNEALRNWDRPRRMPWAEKDLSIVADIASSLGAELAMVAPVAAAVEALKQRRGLPRPLPQQT